MLELSSTKPQRFTSSAVAGLPTDKFTGTVGYVRPIDAIDEIVPNVANPSLGGNIAQR
jgi:hypothetical protein